MLHCCDPGGGYGWITSGQPWTMDVQSTILLLYVFCGCWAKLDTQYETTFRDLFMFIMIHVYIYKYNIYNTTICCIVISRRLYAFAYINENNVMHFHANLHTVHNIFK